MVAKERTRQQEDENANKKVNESSKVPAENSAKETQKIVVHNIKNDFFQSKDKITWSLYVKDIDPSQSHVEFGSNGGSIRFKTKDAQFLRQNSTDDAGTLFEWNVDFYDQVLPDCCAYKINRCTMEINLRLANENKWASPIKRPSSSTANEERDVKKKPSLNNVEINKNNQSSESNANNPKIENAKNNANTENTGNSEKQKLENEPLKKNENRFVPTGPTPTPAKTVVKNTFTGLTGLVNLGNTCYMNAAIQLLVNCTDLRDYFLDKPQVFQKELNTNNALGLNGKMAVTFAVLLRQLWTSNMSSVAPSKLRDLVAQKYAHFRGYEQQDTQEFLCSLLSILHEDLNRVLKKPFYESSLECENDSDATTFQVAEESWKRFLSRDDSVVVDNFYGQFKSKLTCPECNRVSITFEPFNNLLIPIAKSKKLINFVLIFSHFRNKPSAICNIYATEDDTMAEVEKSIKNVYPEVKNSLLRLFVVEKCSNGEDEDSENLENCGFRFSPEWKILSPDDRMPDLKENKILIVNEIDDHSNENDLTFELRVQQTCKYPLLEHLNTTSQFCSFCFKSASVENTTTKIQNLPRCTRCYRSAYCDTKCQTSDWQKHSSTLCNKPADTIGLPFIIAISKHEIKTLSEKRNKLISDTIRELLLEMTLRSVDMEHVNENSPSGQFFELELVEKSPADGEKAKITKVTGQNFDNFISFLEAQKPAKSSTMSAQQATLTFNLNLKWLNYTHANATNVKLKTNIGKLVNKKAIEPSDNCKKHSSNLDDCVRLFTQPEKLTTENPWYCSKCKKHQEATKQMSIWKLPKYLMVTMKRFQATKASDNFFGMNEETAKFMMMNSRFSYLMQNRVVYNKLNTFVDFPLNNFDMSKYVLNKNDNKSYVYDLCGVINHLGNSLSLGHYTAFARTHDSSDSTKDEFEWRLFDDERVMNVKNPKHIVSQDAYVLMYRLRDNHTMNTHQGHDGSATESKQASNSTPPTQEDKLNSSTSNDETTVKQRHQNELVSDLSPTSSTLSSLSQSASSSSDLDDAQALNANPAFGPASAGTSNNADIEDNDDDEFYSDESAEIDENANDEFQYTNLNEMD